MSLRKLKKYKLEFQAIKEEEEREDPAEKLEVGVLVFMTIHLVCF